jgi:hypothetical protein
MICVSSIRFASFCFAGIMKNKYIFTTLKNMHIINFMVPSIQATPQRHPVTFDGRADNAYDLSTFSTVFEAVPRSMGFWGFVNQYCMHVPFHQYE